MREYTITVAEKRHPKSDKGPYWIRPTDRDVPGLTVWADQAAQMNEGGTYNVKCTAGEYNGKTQLTVKEVQAVEGAPKTNGHASTSHIPHIEKDARMAAMGFANRQGSAGMSVSELMGLYMVAYTAWKDFEKQVAYEAKADPLEDKDIGF
jgi:hypothetical protein